MNTTIEIEFAPYALIVRSDPVGAGIPMDALAGIQALADSYGFDLIDAGAGRPLRAVMVITNAKQVPVLRQAIEDAARESAAGNALEEWLAGPDTGASSLAIVEVLAGRSGLTENHQGPSDPSDFSRCRKLLEVMPEWRDRLSEVADAYPSWAPIVGAWDELEDLYVEEQSAGVAPKLYTRMKELREEV